MGRPTLAFDAPRLVVHDGSEWRAFCEAVADMVVPQSVGRIGGVQMYTTTIVPRGEAWLWDGEKVTRLLFTPEHDHGEPE